LWCGFVPARIFILRPHVLFYRRRDIQYPNQQWQTTVLDHAPDLARPTIAMATLAVMVAMTIICPPNRRDTMIIIMVMTMATMAAVARAIPTRSSYTLAISIMVRSIIISLSLSAPSPLAVASIFFIAIPHAHTSRLSFSQFFTLMIHTQLYIYFSH
jgi:hypothetical protein